MSNVESAFPWFYFLPVQIKFIEEEDIIKMYFLIYQTIQYSI